MSWPHCPGEFTGFDLKNSWESIWKPNINKAGPTNLSFQTDNPDLAIVVEKWRTSTDKILDNN